MIDLHTLPAFPLLGNGNQGFDLINPGMTLLDHFAGEALNGLLANTQKAWFGDNHSENNKAYAHVAYLLADAMLEARHEFLERKKEASKKEAIFNP